MMVIFRYTLKRCLRYDISFYCRQIPRIRGLTVCDVSEHALKQKESTESGMKVCEKWKALSKNILCLMDMARQYFSSTLCAQCKD